MKHISSILVIPFCISLILVFYQSGEIQNSRDLKIGMDSPGLAIVNMDGSKLKAITVADPTRKLNRIHRSVTDKINKKGLNFATSWNNEKGNRGITIDLSQKVYVGKSITIEL